MYHLFQTHSTSIAGGQLYPGFTFARQGLQRQLAQVITYRRKNPGWLNGGHLLVKLLQSLNVPLSMETVRYNDQVTDVALDYAMSWKLTSALSKGRLWQPGVFYGAGVSEVLIASIDTYDVSLVEERWRDLCPIRVMSHPKTDLGLIVPDGKTATAESGIAVIVINIPMLASQYRMWRRTEGSPQDESPRSVMQFLTQYPLPNMLYSQLELTLLNRTIATFFERPLAVETGTQPFYLTDYSQPLQATCEDYLRRVISHPWDFDTMLSVFPCVSYHDLHAVIAEPALAYTVQVQWAIVLARLPLLAFLVKLNALTDNPRNRTYLQAIKRYLRQLNLNRSLHTALPREQFQIVRRWIEDDIAPYL